ncbi:TMEM164 family-domain-containing protein [Umbelopsis sp. PMI_123]|nr:TMEM164 family-domain-containing protein [Umbelopsis sp. PMI_123]
MNLLSSGYNTLGNWITEFAPSVPTETDWSQSAVGSWYVPPSQHGLELMCLSLFFALGTTYFGLAAFGPGLNRKLLFNFASTRKQGLVERTLFTALAVSLATTYIHKVIRGTVLFMLQPCHMSAMLLLLVMSWPDKSSPIPHVLFNIYLHTFWGTIAALLFPDLRDHYLLGETFNFFAEHIIILILPFYMAYSGRYLVLPPSTKVAMFSFMLYGLYHSPLIHVVALKTSININYIFSPPPSKCISHIIWHPSFPSSFRHIVGFLIKLGVMYRPFLYLVAMVNMFISRYILMGSTLYVLPKRGRAKND